MCCTRQHNDVWNSPDTVHHNNVGLLMNGKSFPATGAIVAKKGQRIRVRFMKEGLQIHPMHLYGFLHDGLCTRWRAGTTAVPVRCPECGARTAFRCPDTSRRTRRVGIPLPHSHARRIAARLVWDGDGADCELKIQAMTGLRTSEAPSLLV